MQDGTGDPNKQGGMSDGMTVRDENARILWLTVFSVAVVFFVASLYPPPLFFAIFSGLLTLSAGATALVAFLTSQNPLGRVLTLWDKVALLAFLGLATGLLVDMAALQAFIDANAPAQTSAPGAPLTVTGER